MVASSTALTLQSGEPTLRAETTILPKGLSPEAMLVCLLWSVQIVLSPIYVFESGLPQPADFLMVGVAALTLLFKGFHLPRPALPLVRLLFFFAMYTLAINFWWYLRLGHQGLLFTSLYYFYNWLAFCTFLSLYTWLGTSIVNLTCWSMVLSALMQFVVSLQVIDVGLNEAVRVALLSKNPNQTAYYAVLIGSFLLICGRFGYLPGFLRLWMPFFLSQLGYLTALTQSRAGLASIGLIVGIFAIRRIVTGLLAGIILFVGLRSPLGEQLIHVISERVEQKQKTIDEELAYRGYARIWQNREYLIFGAGEGAYERFEVLWGKELHSTFGNILMSYGVIGFSLMGYFFWRLFRLGGWKNLLGFLPAFAYGLTHNGIRQSELWMMAALVICLHLHRSRRATESHASVQTQHRKCSVHPPHFEQVNKNSHKVLPV